MAPEEWILHRGIQQKREAELSDIHLPQADSGGHAPPSHRPAMDEALGAHHGKDTVLPDMDGNDDM